MAVVQVNTPGLQSTDAGYISEIKVYYNGQVNTLTPDGTTGQVTIDADAATRLVQSWAQFKLITG